MLTSNNAAPERDDANITCESRVVAFCHLLTRLAVVVVSAIGLTVLVSWASTIPPMKDLLRGWFGTVPQVPPVAGITMKANTSICLLCAGGAMAILHRANRSQLLRWSGRLLALIVLAVAGLTFAEHVFGRDFGIDQLLFSEPPGAVATVSPNRAGPLAASCLLLGGLALLTLDLRTRRGRSPSQVMALAICLISLFPLIGYAYQLEPLYSIPYLTGISLPATLALGALGVGLLCARPDRGMMAVVCASDAGGMMSRRLLIPAVLLPLLLGWLQIRAQRAGWIDPSTGEAVQAVALLVVLVVLVGSATVAVGRASRNRIAAEENVRARAEELEALFAAAPLPLWVARDRECQQVTGNAAANSLLGLSRMDSSGGLGIQEAPKSRFMRGREAVPLEQLPLQRAAREAKPVLNEEYQLVTEAGFCSDVVLSAVPLLDQKGGVRGCLAVAMDITAVKQAEVAAREARDAAEAASRFKDQFMAMLSHELRTPLTPVVTLIQMLQQDPQLPPAVHETVQTIRRNLELEVRLIDDLLDLTRISRGKLVLRTQRIDLHDLIKHTTADCNADIRGKGLTLELRLTARQTLVDVDESRFQQVLLNLLRNSIKFTPSGGRIIVSSGTEGRNIICRVQDTGIGIESDALSRIFGAFEQAGGMVTRQYGGLGLGLAVSRAIVQAHGGNIIAASEGRDRGSTFTVSLLLAPVQIKRSLPADYVAGAAALVPSEELRILLVEDHTDTARAMSRLLSTMGYRVRTADTVAAALRAADAEAFDLLLCDVGLPDGTGLDLMRQLLHRAGKPVKGIALSGFGMDSDIRSSREAGFAAHLVKPVNLKELQATIQRVALPLAR